MPDVGLHQIFAGVAAGCPQATALVAGGRRVSYGELDRLTDAWAAGLAAAGVGAGSHVPIVLPRGIDLIIGLLAVLKTGAAYGVLDPAWPDSRLRAVIEDLGATLAIADADGPSLPVTRWTARQSPLSPADGPAFEPVAVAGGDPCCLFFTSGTTGRPKAVLATHAANARLFSAGGFARFGAGAVMPLAAPPSWDAFALELWAMLLTGGTCVIIDEPYLSAHALREVIALHGVDTVWLTASLFNLVVDEDPAAFAGLRQLMIGGERLSARHVAAFLRDHPGIALLNGYGPVESTVFVTTHWIEAGDPDRPGGIPLGRPVPGTSVHVLDGDRICEVGETGEICVAGEGLALGYLHDPLLTEAKFTTVELGGEKVRVYRTGDLGNWDGSGLLHYGGRTDRQVKIRGHRVEPAEVERQMENLLPITSCHVLARRDACGAVRDLVAFCVPVRPGDPLTGADDVLRTAVAAYQRPALVVSVGALPVTDRGKVDERALLAMVPQASFTASHEHDDPTVRLVAQTVASVTGQTSVPVDITFTELGCTSLALGRICARLSAQLDRPVPVSRAYDHPTAQALGGWLADTASTLEDLPPGPDGAVPLTPLQLVYLTNSLVWPIGLTSHCMLTWVIDGPVDVDALEEATVIAHQRHEALCAAYLPDPRPMALAVNAPAPPLFLLPAQATVEAAVMALRVELADPLAIMEGEVWRTAFVPVRGRDTAVFGCVVHHIAFDGWSESVLATDISQAYRDGYDVGPPAPSLVEVYREYTRRLAAADLAEHRFALQTELSGVPELRWPEPPSASAPAAPGHLERMLGPDLVARVDACAAACRVTRFTVLLAVCAGAIREVTGQDDFAVGVPVAQRSGRGLDQVVGCHINMVCVRLRGAALGGDHAAVRATAQVVARAFAAQDVPFSEVLDRVGPPRTGRPPMYQVLFALQDNQIPDLHLPGLHTRFIRQPYLELPLELHVEIWPAGDGSDGLRLVVSFRPEAVAESTVREFTTSFIERLHTITDGGRP